MPYKLSLFEDFQTQRTNKVLERDGWADLRRSYPQGALFQCENLNILNLLLKDFEESIDLVYIDPPYNTNENFYFTPERAAHISHSTKAEVAYSDKLPFPDYLKFMKERLILIRKLLSPRGTIYLHIDVNRSHYLKILLDEIFGRDNFVNEISRIKGNPKNFKRKAFGNQKDIILIYSKQQGKQIFNDVREPFTEAEIIERFPKIDQFGRRYTTVPCHAPGETKSGSTGEPWRGMQPPEGRHWRSSPHELEILDSKGLIEWSANNVPRIKKYAAESRGKKIQDVWLNFKDPQYPVYPTEKNMDMLEMIVKQSSLSGSIIMDCFCGSGSFLAAGRKNGRRVIGVDESEIAISVASQRPELLYIPVIKF